jgi:hypothetical protein
MHREHLIEFEGRHMIVLFNSLANILNKMKSV